MKNELVELKNINKARGEIYSFFDQCFRLIPDADFMQMIEGNLEHLKTLANSSSNKDMQDGVTGLELFFEKRAALAGAVLAEYNLDANRRYASMFCMQDSVPMVESYYTSVEKLVMQEARDEVLKKMRKYGFKRSNDINEYDDHISIECAFISRLAALSAQAIEDNNLQRYNDLIDDQLLFHKDHFDRWVDRFVQDVIDYPIDGEILYKSLCRFARGYIAEDKGLLSEIKVNMQ